LSACFRRRRRQAPAPPAGFATILADELPNNEEHPGDHQAEAGPRERIVSAPKLEPEENNIDESEMKLAARAPVKQGALVLTMVGQGREEEARIRQVGGIFLDGS